MQGLDVIVEIIEELGLSSFFESPEICLSKSFGSTITFNGSKNAYQPHAFDSINFSQKGDLIKIHGFTCQFSMGANDSQYFSYDIDLKDPSSIDQIKIIINEFF